MIWVYVIQSKLDNGYYIGITKDIQNRLKKHNKGGVSITKKRKPFSLVYTEEFENYKKARLREIELKSYKGGNKLKVLLKD
ncbi:MAG TPA: GIY-YIG nuclease family protein [Patescibacteria group bacterium]|nr:GIY-YIG nuclease family protein [Patescibacteria group bacterium]